MSLKLNQIIAVEKGLKERTEKAVTGYYQSLSKAENFSGLHKEYKPLDEEGERFPNEDKLVQTNVADLYNMFAASYTDLVSVIQQQEEGNCVARADIKVGDVVLAKNVPVMVLVRLEKIMENAHTMTKNSPTYDLAEKWTFNEATNMYVSDTVKTSKTRKITGWTVVVEPTEHQAAIVKETSRDELTGYWHTNKFSAALSPAAKKTCLAKVAQLWDAVKKAREEANNTEVPKIEFIGNEMFKFIFG